MLVQIRPTRARRAVPLVTEAFAYVGGILLLAGGGAAVGQRWEDIGQAGRVAVLASAAALFLVVGAVSRRSPDPAYQRLTSSAWLLAGVGVAGTAGVSCDWGALGDESTMLIVTGTTTVFSAALWTIHRSAVQLLTALVMSLYAVTGLWLRFAPDAPQWLVPLSIWAVGVGSAVAGWRKYVVPWWAALGAGLVVALAAPVAVEAEPGRYVLGIATAAAVMTLGVLAGFVPGLALGSLAMLGYVVGVVTRYLADSLGVPAALAVAGLSMLALAAVVTRAHGHRPGVPSAAEPTRREELTKQG
jgi:hypothetical protein